MQNNKNNNNNNENQNNLLIFSNAELKTIEDALSVEETITEITSNPCIQDGFTQIDVDRIEKKFINDSNPKPEPVKIDGSVYTLVYTDLLKSSNPIVQTKEIFSVACKEAINIIEQKAKSGSNFDVQLIQKEEGKPDTLLYKNTFGIQKTRNSRKSKKMKEKNEKERRYNPYGHEVSSYFNKQQRDVFDYYNIKHYHKKIDNLLEELI